MRARTQSERRVGRRNLVAGILFGVIVATVAGAYATTVFKKMVAGKPATAADVNAAHQDLATAIDKLETKVNAQATQITAQAAEITKLKTEPDCPPGYTKSTTVTAYTLCTRGKDEMVKVGDFWVDRYEMSVVDATSFNGGKCDGTGTVYGSGGSDNFPATYPDSGNYSVALYACSRSGNVPSRVMTWFQAQQACVAAGKQLCANGQWQAAAAGTPDDSASCNVSTSAPEKTGARPKCLSNRGAYDMVGNLWEWVDMWGQAGKVNTSFSSGAKATPWPSGYGDGQDGTWNLNGEAHDGSKWTTGLPAAALRGGGWNNGPGAGVFAVYLYGGPSRWDTPDGARCCRQ